MPNRLPSSIFALLSVVGTLHASATSEVRQANMSGLANATVEVAGEVVGKPALFVDAALGDSPRFAVLEGAVIKATFPTPVPMRAIAIPRIGYGDWAIPARVTVSVNGKSLGPFLLTAPRVVPNAKQPLEGVDVIDWGDATPVSTLEVRVDSIEATGTNKHGSLRILGVDPATVAIDLFKAGAVPEASEGVEIEVEAEKPVPAPVFFARLFQFRKDRQVSVPVAALPAGKSRIVIRWDELDLKAGFPSPATPLNFFALGIADSAKLLPVKLVSWKFLPSASGREVKPAWSFVKDRNLPPDAEGWRPGIPSDGFGRFGWLQESGLLAGWLRPDGFQISAVDAGGASRTAEWKIALGEARQIRWQRTRTDWTTVEHEAFLDFSTEVKNELAAKAPELLKELREPQRVLASILAPGFLIDSKEKSLSLARVPDGKQPSGSAMLIYPTAQGVKSAPAGKPVDGALLSEGWIAATWPGAETMPLMLALKKRPGSITISNEKLDLTFPGPLERVAVAFPFGYRQMQTPDSGQAPALIAAQARKLAPILRAYPSRATQRFRDAAGDGIEVEERFGHIFWTNDWQEPSRVIAPVSPLLIFAKSQGYPLTLPGNLVTDLNWPTKYGPYGFVEGSTAQTRLPVPPMETTFYLRPSSDPLADQVAAELVVPVRATPFNWLRNDTLSTWYLRASSSLGFPLLDAGQKRHFLEEWREALDQGLQAHAWYLRTEPFSGSRYPVSFGWVEPHTETLGDVNSGAGAVLYALWSYARCSGDWKFVEDRWPMVRGAVEYFFVQHDWAVMQTGAREHSGSSAIDMDTIGYEGVVAYAQMAKVLGHDDEAALARLLAARVAVPTSVRWLGRNWVGPKDEKKLTWNAIGVGFSENAGFDFLSSSEGGPDHANSELALSLSWVGQFPEMYDLHVWGLGETFWNWFENSYVETRVANWRKDHPGNRNNHAANIAAHLYLRGLLGAPPEAMRAELEQQAPWGLAPKGPVARENAGFYALLLGRHFPLVLRSWGAAAIREASFDESAGEATISFASQQPFDAAFDVSKPIRQAAINGVPAKIPTGPGPAKWALPAGETTLKINF